MDIKDIIQKYSKLIYKICFDMLGSPEDAEDTVQEVYISYYINSEKYGTLKENEIKNIICKIALNKCRDILKSKAKKLENITDNDEEALEKYPYNNHIDERIFEAQRKQFIEKNINKLKQPYKQVIYDYYILEKKIDEIAIKNSVSAGTVKMQIHRGKKILREKIEESGGANYYV